MAKKKFTLTDLKVNSFITTLENGQMNRIKGGIYVVHGRKYTYRTRWTTIDTRSDVSDTQNIGNILMD